MPLLDVMTRQSEPVLVIVTIRPLCKTLHVLVGNDSDDYYGTFGQVPFAALRMLKVSGAARNHKLETSATR